MGGLRYWLRTPLRSFFGIYLASLVVSVAVFATLHLLLGLMF
jgi:hypothetical protein